METNQFSVKATGSKVDLEIAVTVRATSSCMDAQIVSTKNVVFDMLRSQDFDVDKIIITSNG